MWRRGSSGQVVACGPWFSWQYAMDEYRRLLSRVRIGTRWSIALQASMLGHLYGGYMVAFLFHFRCKLVCVFTRI